MGKTHGLEIRVLHELDGGALGCYSKGHHDATAFSVAAFGEGFTFATADRVRQAWWRCVPVSGDRFIAFHGAAANARGAFPVTYAER